MKRTITVSMKVTTGSDFQYTTASSLLRVLVATVAGHIENKHKQNKVEFSIDGANVKV